MISDGSWNFGLESVSITLSYDCLHQSRYLFVHSSIQNICNAVPRRIRFEYVLFPGVLTVLLKSECGSFILCVDLMVCNQWLCTIITTEIKRQFEDKGPRVEMRNTCGKSKRNVSVLLGWPSKRSERSKEYGIWHSWIWATPKWGLLESTLGLRRGCWWHNT